MTTALEHDWQPPRPEEAIDESAAHGRRRRLGDVAKEREPLPVATRCAVIDESFREDPTLRSVVVDAGGRVLLVNRSAFYEALSGKLGFGWSLFHDAPLSRLLDRVARGAMMPAAAFLEDAALELLSRGHVDSEQDLMVTWEDGRVGTLSVSVVLADLFQVHANQVRRLQSSENRLSALVHNSFDALVVLDRLGVISYVSSSVASVSGYRPKELLHTALSAHVHDEDAAELRALFADCAAGTSMEVRGELRMRDLHEKWACFELSMRNLLELPEVGGIVVHFRDISERKRLEERLRHDALHDPLTGLPNRAYITERARLLLEESQGENATSVLFIDIDHFKDVNDTLGHAAGDELLRMVADRLSTMLRQTDTIGRLGGDEFVVLVEGALDAEFFAQRILELFETPFTLHGLEHRISASVGVATGRHCGVAELVQHADIALYQAKAAGRSTYRVFVGEMLEHLEGRIALERDLVRALEEWQFFLVYQPIYDLCHLGISGFEALLRWKHPDQGELAPDEFIASLESSGLIRPVGRRVLTDACRQMAAWHELGYRLQISVNVSGCQLDTELVGDVEDALRDSGLDASSLVLELTESTLMQNCESTVELLAQLKRLGVKLAVDDLGTGYSSLTYLRAFPIDIAKIDRSFIIGAAEPGGVALIHTLVELGRSLGLTTVAEGVETAEQLALLRDEHCNRVQGYCLSRPLTSERASELLAALPLSPP